MPGGNASADPGESLGTFSKQWMLVGAIVMGFVLFAAVALFSQGAASIIPREATSKQYTVKKSRDSAQGIASSDRKIDRAAGEAPATEPIQSLTPDSKRKTTRVRVPVKSDAPTHTNTKAKKIETGVASIIAQSYSADTTQLAMDLLTSALAEMQSPDDESKLYSAIGSLQLAQQNPDTEAGLAAMRNATESAPTSTVRTKAAVAEASALMLHTDSATGLARINEMLDDDGIEAEGGRHLKLLRGDLLVEQGDLRAAESAYESVRQAVSPAGVLSDSPSDALYRQASLRLARLYARSGDTKKEAVIARDLKRATAPKR